MQHRDPNLVDDETKDVDCFFLLAAAVLHPAQKTYGEILSIPELIWARKQNELKSGKLAQIVYLLHSGQLSSFLENMGTLQELLAEFKEVCYG